MHSAACDRWPSRPRMRLAVALIALAATFVPTGVASAHPSIPVSTMLHRTSVRIAVRRIHGHLLKIISWQPGDPHLAVTVNYSSHRLPPVMWGARDRSNLAVLNGGTWRWRTGVPTGTVVSRGRVVHIARRIPAVGYTASGEMVLGTGAAFRAHARNIIGGKAYLVAHGRAITRRPGYVTPTQWSCDAVGTDGSEGCYRSVVARFRSGRVGMIEMAYIGMPTAARLLVRMGADAAITFDSGGSATQWSAAGHSGCPHHFQRGSCFGLTQRMGLHWQRPVPSVTVLSYTP